MLETVVSYRISNSAVSKSGSIISSYPFRLVRRMTPVVLSTQMAPDRESGLPNSLQRVGTETGNFALGKVEIETLGGFTLGPRLNFTLRVGRPW